uniref:Vacuolar protein sorting-associated protein 54 n=2 Tax=Anthurium amnicola TaxID=1678845 RepID=A0A1D1YES5_9ARAE
MDAVPSHRGRSSLIGGSTKHQDLIPLGRTNSSSSTDSPSYAGGGGASGSQSLASILNNPHAGRSDAPWSTWWPYGAAIAPELPPSIVPSSPIPEVNRVDFQPYLSSILESYARFEDVRKHTSKEIADGAEIKGQGEALVACLREVPSLFFKEDFALEDGATFRAACPFSPVGLENSALQEKLSHYLDVVELHLVKEISLRSDSFFEAQGQLQGLNGEILEACIRIRELKETIRILNANLVDSARQVQELNATRGNLVELQQKLTVILYVSQALSALKLLVASADCAGALDVIDDLQHLLDSDELAGLHCFRHLRDQLAQSIDSINSILSAEFLHAAIHDAKNLHSVILVKFKGGADSLIGGIEEDVKLDDDERSNFRDRLLPLMIGLLRIAKFPSVLRIYRETLIAAMKATIKNTVAELLPFLGSRSLDSDLTIAERTVDTDGGSSLASKLRNLSPESFVQLLATIFRVVQAHLVRAAEVKRMIEWILGNLDGYAVDSVAAVSAPAEASLENSFQGSSSSSTSFPRNVAKVPFLYGRINDTFSPSTSKNFRADVLRENAEALFAACDAAHGRWAKLLSVRALLHPKLKLQEFLSIYNITQAFITTTEKIGGRMGYGIRGTLQSQSKTFFDFQHDSRMTKIKAVLDQETWVTVDVPEEFQAIVDSFSSDVSNISMNMTTNDNEPVLNGITVEQTPRQDDFVEIGHRKYPVQNDDGNTSEQGRSASQTLAYRGIGYHMVNCGLILLKTLSEYVDISKCLPALSPEVGHRVVEILKFFNTRTCQLVLGAGAMQVSGLKSITSKHLALASQVISFISVIIPEIRRVLFLKIPEIRKAVLLADIDKVTQDYKVHRDEIHSKLVQIMRERLLANIRKLPQIVESWNGSEDIDEQPSLFARSVTKEVSYLHRILSQTLLEMDVQLIFRQVVQIFHLHISEAFSKLDISTPQAKNRLHRDVQHILGCIRKLPADHSSIDSVPNRGLLDEFLEQRFGSQPSP